MNDAGKNALVNSNLFEKKIKKTGPKEPALRSYAPQYFKKLREVLGISTEMITVSK